MSLRVAVLGQGSIGRRHATLALAAGCEVRAWDPTGVVVAGAVSEDSPEGALAACDVAVVASPSVEHLAQARLALEHGCHVLVEKPLALTLDGTDELVALAEGLGLVAAVAMNLRFHDGPRLLRETLDSGAVGRPVVSFLTCGSWLPGWRPGTDYRQAYSARAALGGGVALDAIHELDYAAWILGPVSEVDARLARRTDLEIDVEDVALFTLAHASGTLSTVALDYADRDYRRGMRIVGTDGTASWTWGEGAVRVVTGDGERLLPAPSDAAATYARQMDHLLAASRGGPFAPLCGLSEGRKAVAVVAAGRESSSSGRRVRLG